MVDWANRRYKKLNSDDKFSIFELPMKEIDMGEEAKEKKVRMLCFEGCERLVDIREDEKVVLVVGQTGNGKTTLVNAMVNHIMGVQYSDRFRLKLILDADELVNEADITQSQTNFVTAYRLPQIDKLHLPYPVTIVDSPGFGSTTGEDEKIIESIKYLFEETEIALIGVHGIAFVVQSSTNKLTDTVKFIWDSTLGIFGKDMGTILFGFATWYDGNKPKVFNALNTFNIHRRKDFNFNNGSLFDDPEEIDDIFAKKYWKMNKKSFDHFFNELISMDAISLHKTREVLQRKEQLSRIIRNIINNVRSGLTILESLENDLKELRRHKYDLEIPYTYTVEEETIVKVDLPEGYFVTNCTQCNKTCHYPCKMRNDDDKKNCKAMKNGICQECRSCPWNVHANMTFRFTTELTSVTKTSDELRKRYDTAQDNVDSKTAIIRGLFQEFLLMRTSTWNLVVQGKETMEQLHGIALRKSAMLNNVTFLDALINNENNQQEKGWKKRRKMLLEMKEFAKTLKDIDQTAHKMREHCTELINQYAPEVILVMKELLPLQTPRT